MMKVMRNWLGVLALALAVAASGPAVAQDASAPKSSAKRAPQGSGHVYLFRGLLNIFSLGMDDLASKIQAKGISASVYNHSEWQSVADEIAAKYKAGRHGPVVLVGHSLGADAVMHMSQYLGKKGVPVALVVPFDGTASFAASSNVRSVMNLTQRDYAYMRKGNGFRGQLSNIDVSNQAGIDHINIDKSARLHGMVLSRIQSVLGRGGGQAPRHIVNDGSVQAPRARPAAAPQPAMAPAEAVKPHADISTSSVSRANGAAPKPDAPAAQSADKPQLRF